MVAKRVGSPYFQSLGKALSYYTPYFNDVPNNSWGERRMTRPEVVWEAVQLKLEKQEIYIGIPKVEAPDYVVLTEEGRYDIVTPLTPAVTV